MYPLWSTVVEPALVAAGATRVVEIGSQRGKTTTQLFHLLGPESELHVIDPVPMFDPTEHARRFPGRYVFHRDISHNVLPELPPCDAALIDGDHNWFTVYHELRMLSETARKAGVPMPLCILHDVCWPYGQRDLYHAPEQIPEEFRQPYERRGILPGRSELAEEGGLNQQLPNAIHEGGPRNGVATALDDFVAEHDRPLRRVLLPLFHGLALIAEQDRLDARPELAALLDRLEGAEVRYELLELCESIRVREQAQQHGLRFSAESQAERSARRYLELLKGALLDEHYIENELRIEHLLECVKSGTAASPDALRDPARSMSRRMRQVQQARQTGRRSSDDPDADGWRDGLAYTTIGRARLDHLEGCLDVIRKEEVEGDLVECGAGRGGAAMFMRGFVEAYELSDPRIWVADRFGGGSTPNGDGAPAFPIDLNAVREGFARFGLFDDRVRFLQGPPDRTLADAPIPKVALLRVGSQDPADIRAALEALYDRITLGGFVVVDADAKPSRRAVIDDFRSERGVVEPLERVGWEGQAWRKTADAGKAGSPAGGKHERSLAPPTPRPTTATKDLSVVVVFRNMRREATRTLHSLSRAYQQGVEDLDYEVIAVENGSEHDERLGDELVSSFGPEFRYIDVGDEATPSPAWAANRGMAVSNGRAIALMIDGAHLLTPGVLRNGMLGLSAYAPAVVTTKQWYVGPGQQPEAVAHGYDREVEDRLFERIDWPLDGYRLFEIGHFIGERDWFDGDWESNCVFMPRRLLDQVGGMDEAFSKPGGGFVNLDLFERMAASPDVTVVAILGEGSFHQVHGGTTTNAADPAERSELIGSYEQQYEELRGHRFRVPSEPMHYVGMLRDSARRTRARRMGAPEHFKAAQVDADGRPTKPQPVPDEQKTEFIDAFWRSGEWHRTTWLGRSTHRAPTDLLAYQDLIFCLRPDWIIETRTGTGGRAMFLASICDLIGSGRVLSIDDYPVPDLPEHPRITYLRSPPAGDRTAAEVRGTVGQQPRAMVILGGADHRQVLSAFERYAPLVPVGSYVVVEDTILGGHPVWTGFGPGPADAVRAIARAREFAPDPSFERYAVTFNPGGFLKRIREGGSDGHPTDDG
jgi:cephalosporin hydroxylase